MPDAEKDAPTCRVCYAKSLSNDERDWFYSEPVTGCIYLCPEHQAAMDEAVAALPPVEFIKARRAAQPRPSRPENPERSARLS